MIDRELSVAGPSVAGVQEPTADDELQRRRVALEEEMESPRRWLAGRSDLVIR